MIFLSKLVKIVRFFLANIHHAVYKIIPVIENRPPGKKRKKLPKSMK